MAILIKVRYGRQGNKYYGPVLYSITFYDSHKMTTVDVRKLYKPNGYLAILVININMALGILGI